MTRRVKRIHARHVDIENDNRRRMLVGKLYSICPIRCFSNDAEVIGVVQYRNKRCTN